MRSLRLNELATRFAFVSLSGNQGGSLPPAIAAVPSPQPWPFPQVRIKLLQGKLAPAELLAYMKVREMCGSFSVVCPLVTYLLCTLVCVC